MSTILKSIEYHRRVAQAYRMYSPAWYRHMTHAAAFTKVWRTEHSLNLVKS